MRARVARGLLFLLASVAGGCASDSHWTPGPVAATQAIGASASVRYDGADGFTASYLTAGWKPVNRGGDFLLALAADGWGNSPLPAITIEVPKLPLHIPGLLPMNLVASGYVEDVKRRHPNYVLYAEERPPLDGEHSRQFQFGYDGQVEAVALTVHGDHVFVVVATCDQADWSRTKLNYQHVLASLRWTKKP
jgi:hypothetical protein